jgi:hypothetical protein
MKMSNGIPEINPGSKRDRSLNHPAEHTPISFLHEILEKRTGEIKRITPSNIL